MTSEPPAFDRLTPAEKECLRLAYRGYNSKEIARERGTQSSDRIDKLIGSAKMKLGNVSRREAARMLHEHEDGAKPAISSKSAPSRPVRKTGVRLSDLPSSTKPGLNEASSAPQHGAATEPGTGPGSPSGLSFGPQAATALPAGFWGDRRNELDALPRMAMVIVIAAAGAVTISAIFALLFILDHLVAGN